MYAGRTPPGEAPCRTCRIDPMEDNRDALSVFFETRYQLIGGMDSPLQLNHLAVDAAIDRQGIRDRQECFNKIFHSSSKDTPSLAGWWVERIRNKDGE